MFLVNYLNNIQNLAVFGGGVNISINFFIATRGLKTRRLKTLIFSALGIGFVTKIINKNRAKNMVIIDIYTCYCLYKHK